MEPSALVSGALALVALDAASERGSMFTVSALRTELLTDPTGIGYSTAVTRADHNTLVDQVNRFAVSYAVSMGTVTSIAMQTAVVPGEYGVLSNGQRDLWNAVLVAAVNGVPISNTVIRTQVAFVWSAGTTTRANLLALDTRSGTRAEVLFGEGVRVTSTDVQKALE